MNPLLIIYILSSFFTFLHTLGQALAGMVLGLQVEEFGLFGGPSIARIHLGGILWNVRLLPGLGGYVKFHDDDGNKCRNGDNDLHPISRMLIHASGNFAIVAVALACLGPLHAARSVWHGFGQVVTGALAPVGTGTPLARSLVQLIRVSPPWIAVGIVAAKKVVVNLVTTLPITLSWKLWPLIQGRGRFSEYIDLGASAIYLLGLLIFVCGWLYAIARVLTFG